MAQASRLVSDHKGSWEPLFSWRETVITGAVITDSLMAAGAAFILYRVGQLVVALIAAVKRK